MKRKAFTQSQIRYLRDRAEEQYENMRGSRSFRNVSFLLYIALVVLVALTVRSFIAEPIRVDGDSMVPTLMHNEDMLVEKMSYWFSDPQRGDIIICYYPGYTESCVKRVIGLPGETIELKKGELYVNGEHIEQQFDMTPNETDFGPFTVPEGHYFMMGDNRDNSKDSRSPMVGALERKMIKGHVRCVVFPLSKARVLGK